CGRSSANSCEIDAIRIVRSRPGHGRGSRWPELVSNVAGATRVSCHPNRRNANEVPPGRRDLLGSAPFEREQVVEKLRGRAFQPVNPRELRQGEITTG